MKRKPNWTKYRLDKPMLRYTVEECQLHPNTNAIVSVAKNENIVEYFDTMMDYVDITFFSGTDERSAFERKITMNNGSVIRVYYDSEDDTKESFVMIEFNDEN